MKWLIFLRHFEYMFLLLLRPVYYCNCYRNRNVYIYNKYWINIHICAFYGFNLFHVNAHETRFNVSYKNTTRFCNFLLHIFGFCTSLFSQMAHFLLWSFIGQEEKMARVIIIVCFHKNFVYSMYNTSINRVLWGEKRFRVIVKLV